MKLKNPAIVLEGIQPFAPGQLIRGKAKWLLQRDIRVKNIKLVINGQCKVKWTVGSGDDEKKYKGKEVYINFPIVLFGSLDGGEVSVAAGQYDVPFQYQLSNSIPSTFSSKYGNVFYTISLSAEYSGVFSADDDYHIPFEVLKPTIEWPSTPIRLADNSEDYGCCGSTKMALSYELNVTKNVFAPGDLMVINGFAVNDSNERLSKVKLSLVQQLSVYGKRSDFSLTSSGNLKGKVKHYTVCEWRGDQIRSRGSATYTNVPAFEIPRLPESELRNCQLIDIEYFLQFVLDLDGLCSMTLHSQPATVHITNRHPGQNRFNEPTATPSAPPDITTGLGPQTVIPSSPADDAVPSYNSVINQPPANPLPPSYNDAVAFSSGFSSNAPTEEQSTITAPSQTSYYDWSQSAFTYN